MHTVDDLNAWTNTEVVLQIEALKPVGTAFIHGQDPETLFWTARFETTDGNVLWSDASPDERLSLFNAFGWVWVQSQPQPSLTSRWRRGPELTREVVTKRVALNGHTVPDPEDLNPEEVRAVYEKARPR